MSPCNDVTPRANHVGSLSAEERLERMDDKLDQVLEALGDGKTKFALMQAEIDQLRARVLKLEEGRDAVIKLVLFAVLMGLLGLVGLKGVS